MKNLTTEWAAKPRAETLWKLEKVWCWSTSSAVVQVLCCERTPLGALHGNMWCKNLRLVLPCTISYAVYSADWTTWTWHKQVVFVESCQNLSLQGNPNTSKQMQCICSLKVRRQDKGLKQQTLFFFSHSWNFLFSLKAFIRSLGGVLDSWLEGAGSWPQFLSSVSVTVTVEFLESGARSNMAWPTPNLSTGRSQRKQPLKPLSGPWGAWSCRASVFTSPGWSDWKCSARLTICFCKRPQQPFKNSIYRISVFLYLLARSDASPFYHHHL